MNKYDRDLLSQIDLKLRSGVTSFEEVEILEKQRENIINFPSTMKKVAKPSKLKLAKTAKEKKTLKKSKKK